ncbi:hypothetical protein [Paraburkholderia youngii]|uniref:hypothetical protein n=1 Tax=Paraburkholderia youngii TaxID=2782701 RepID=UPI003D1EA9C9
MKIFLYSLAAALAFTAISAHAQDDDSTWYIANRSEAMCENLGGQMAAITGNARYSNVNTPDKFVKLLRDKIDPRYQIQYVKNTNGSVAGVFIPPNGEEGSSFFIAKGREGCERALAVMLKNAN